jgi:hypothetical protein
MVVARFGAHLGSQPPREADGHRIRGGCSRRREVDELDETAPARILVSVSSCGKGGGRFLNIGQVLKRSRAEKRNCVFEGLCTHRQRSHSQRGQDESLLMLATASVLKCTSRAGSESSSLPHNPHNPQQMSGGELTVAIRWR